jgi:hypothetical protein
MGWIMKSACFVVFLGASFAAIVDCGSGSTSGSATEDATDRSPNGSASQPPNAAAIRQSLDTAAGVYAFLNGKTLVAGGEDLDIPPDPFGVLQCLHQSTIHFHSANGGTGATWDWSSVPGGHGDGTAMCDTSTVGTQPIPGDELHGAPFSVDYASFAGSPDVDLGCFDITMGDMNGPNAWSGRVSISFELTSLRMEVYPSNEVMFADCISGNVGDSVFLNGMSFDGTDAVQVYHIQ